MVASRRSNHQPRWCQRRRADLCSRRPSPYDRPMLAHNVAGGPLPAPPWLLAYLGAALVLGTAVFLRATWLTARGRAPDGEAPTPRLHVGHLVGIALLGAVVYAAVAGPDSAAANIAPVAVLVMWWVGLPLLCLVFVDPHVGDLRIGVGAPRHHQARKLLAA